MIPRRGDVFWVRQPMSRKQAGDASKARRPYLIVSADPWNTLAQYPRLTVCPLTGAENIHRRFDTDVALPAAETGLPKNSVARCVEVYTIFRDELLDRAGQVSGRRMAEVDAALRLYLAL